MRRARYWSLILIVLLPFKVYAEDISGILTELEKMEETEMDISTYTSQIKGDIESLNQQIQSYMTGHYGLGATNYQDYQSWGNGATDWQSVLNMAQGGGNDSGLLGQQLKSASQDFPINTTLINQVNHSPTDQRYYALQAQTTLASRAASQVDFNQIQQEIQYQQKLKDQIDTTDNLKAATDLQNRLQVENNLIQLQLLRQIALLNQQKAIESQGQVNGTVTNAQFLKNP